MADETEKKVKPTPPTYTIEATRNDVTLGAGEIVPFMRLKGKKADTFYPAIKVTLENKDKIFKWIGDSNLLNIVQKSLKAFGQSIAADCVNKEGIFDETLFAKYLTTFTSTGMKLSDIENEIDELQAELTKLIDTDGWTEKPEVVAEIKKLNDDIRSYRQMRDDKQRAPKKEDADEDTVASVPA